jgi:hypothetical protein
MLFNNELLRLTQAPALEDVAVMSDNTFHVVVKMYMQFLRMNDSV